MTIFFFEQIWSPRPRTHKICESQKDRWNGLYWTFIRNSGSCSIILGFIRIAVPSSRIGHTVAAGDCASRAYAQNKVEDENEIVKWNGSGEGWGKGGPMGTWVSERKKERSHRSPSISRDRFGWVTGAQSKLRAIIEFDVTWEGGRMPRYIRARVYTITYTIHRAGDDTASPPCTHHATHPCTGRMRGEGGGGEGRGGWIRRSVNA